MKLVCLMHIELLFPVAPLVPQDQGLASVLGECSKQFIAVKTFIMIITEYLYSATCSKSSLRYTIVKIQRSKTLFHPQAGMRCTKNILRPGMSRYRKSLLTSHRPQLRIVVR